ARAQRRAAQRAASAAYQRTSRGACLHAARMQRCRDRHRHDECKLSANKVTQHPTTQAGAQAMTVPRTDTDVRPERAAEDPHDDESLAMHAAGDAARSEAAAEQPERGRSAQGAAGSTPLPPARAADDARGAEPVERRAAVRCTACGCALPPRARLDAP